MSEQKHTRVVEDPPNEYLDIQSGNATLASVWIHHFIGEDTARKYANTIAAGPELLEALEGMSRLVNEAIKAGVLKPHLTPSITPIIEAANAAIAKATGDGQ